MLTSHTNVTSGLTQTVTLSAIITAYPIPVPSNFTWKKCNITGCINILDEETIDSQSGFQVNTVGLISNLTVKHVNYADFGEYQLTVTNGIGVLKVFKMYLIPQGKYVCLYSVCVW